MMQLKTIDIKIKKCANVTKYSRCKSDEEINNFTKYL